MKNPFDPIHNHDEWIQNDWESDDFIEQQEIQSNMEQNYTEPSHQDSDKKDPWWLWPLTIIIFLMKSPIFWIGIIILIFWIDR